jgi:hypothetical protein
MNTLHPFTTKSFDILTICRQARLSVHPSPPSTWLGQSSQNALHGVVTWTNAIGLTLEKQHVMVFKNSFLFVEAKQAGESGTAIMTLSRTIFRAWPHVPSFVGCLLLGKEKVDVWPPARDRATQRHDGHAWLSDLFVWQQWPFLSTSRGSSNWVACCCSRQDVCSFIFKSTVGEWHSN